MHVEFTWFLREMSNRNILWGVGCKDGWCVNLTNLPLSCADCLEICERHRPGNLKACPGLYNDCVTFFYIQCLQAKSRKDRWDFYILLLFGVLNLHQYVGIWTHTKVIKGSCLPNCITECDENVIRRNCWMTARKETTFTCVLNAIVLSALKIDSSGLPELHVFLG